RARAADWLQSGGDLTRSRALSWSASAVVYWQEDSPMSNQGFGLGGLPYALGFGEFMPQNKSGEEGQRANARLQTQMAQQFFNDTGLVRGPMSSWVTQFMQNGTMPLPLTQALGSVAEAGNTAIGQSYQGAINNLGLRTPMT